MDTANKFAILLVILSAAMHAGRNFLTKKATDKQAFVWWYEVVGLLLFTPLFLIYFPAVSMTSMLVWGFILASGLLHFVYWVLLTKALETGDLSLVYPIMRSSPALVLLFSGYISKRKTKGQMKSEWQTNRNPILVCGFLSIFGYFLILVAFTLDRVSYVVGLRQLSIVFAVLLGGYALKERHQHMRFTSASIIFVGTFFIAIG